MPPTANNVSGYTSVCSTPSLVRVCSAPLPGSAAPDGVNASPPPPSILRSAKNATPTIEADRIVPWRKSAGPSTASAPEAAITDVPACATTATRAPISAPKVSTSWTGRRHFRGKNASKITPTTPAPSTTTMGSSSSQFISGTVTGSLLPGSAPDPARPLRRAQVARRRR